MSHLRRSGSKSYLKPRAYARGYNYFAPTELGLNVIANTTCGDRRINRINS
jgi:hypothetical protein